MEYISVKAASKKHGVTPRWIQKLCENGKIDGAVKLEGSGIWLIPKKADIVFGTEEPCFKKVNCLIGERIQNTQLAL